MAQFSILILGTACCDVLKRAEPGRSVNKFPTIEYDNVSVFRCNTTTWTHYRGVVCTGFRLARTHNFWLPAARMSSPKGNCQVLIFYAARMCVRWCFAEWRINFLLLRGPVPGMIRGEYAETFFGCAVRDPVVISKIAIDRFCFVSVVPTRCF